MIMLIVEEEDEKANNHVDVAEDKVEVDDVEDNGVKGEEDDDVEEEENDNAEHDDVEEEGGSQDPLDISQEPFDAKIYRIYMNLQVRCRGAAPDF